MTPKEKATQLVDEFSNECLLTKEGGKVAALIAVEFAIEFAGGDMNERFDKILYLVEVKHEIEEL
jgi:hypothetical protein